MSNREHSRHEHIKIPERRSIFDRVLEVFNMAAMAGHAEPHVYVSGKNVVASTDDVVVTAGPVFDVLRAKTTRKRQ